jgi:hypothetical protein
LARRRIPQPLFHRGCQPRGTFRAEQYSPITLQDLIDQGVDQVTPWGTSKFAREGGIRNLVSCYGLDRGDGGGVVSLASKPEALKAQLELYSQAPGGR